MNQKTIGILAILGSAFLWAIEPVLVKLSYSNSDFVHTTAIRTFVVVIIAALYVFASYKGDFKINKIQFSALAYIAIVATLMAELIYLYAISKVSVINAVLVAHLQPIFVALMGYIALKEEKLTKFDYLGMLFMMLAGVLVTTRTLGNLSQLRIGTFGDLLVLIAAVLWATTSIVMKRYLSDVNPGAIVFYRYLMAGIVFLAYLAVTSSLAIANIYQILVGVIIGVGMILYYESMKRLKAAQVSSLELASPFFAALMGFLILKEMLTLMQFAGMLLLLVGIYFLSRKEQT